MKRITILLIVAAITNTAFAKVDLVTLPLRDTVQLTIYNSADMTLVRESRALTLKEGTNKLQFSWANTLIDPTSLEMLPLANAGEIDILDLTYPPRVRNLGLWNINSGIAGNVPVEITYLTSGLSWRAFYMGTLAENEETMRLQGYVRVTNNSGEDYENAQTRLIVGVVHILDQIAELAQRPYPYNRPGQPVPLPATPGMPGSSLREDDKSKLKLFYSLGEKSRELSRKEVRKEGLSEYFLYTIEGTETIPTGWSKRLLSFEKPDVPVINLYKYEQQRYGNNVVRFLSFKNDEDHKLGDTPIPGGMLKVYRTADAQQHLGYIGQSSFKYIPVDEDVELNLGGVSDIVVEPTLMNYKTENYRFRRGNIVGWDEVRTFKIEVRNTRDLDVKVEIKHNFPTQYWDISRSSQIGKYQKEDLDTSKFTLMMEPRSKQSFEYILRTYHGTREQDWRPGRQY